MREPAGIVVMAFKSAFALFIGAAFVSGRAQAQSPATAPRPTIERAATSSKYVGAGARVSNNAARATVEGDVLRQPGKSSALAPQPPIAAQSSRTVSPLAIVGPTLLPPTKTRTGSTWQVVLNWLGGTLPYTVVTALNGTFDNGVKTIAEATTATTATVTVNPAAVLNCFDVSDASTLNEATQGIGYTPNPAPTLPNPTVQSAWWGSPVEFVASYLDPIAQANTAFFFDLPARGTQTDGGSPPSWVQFTIPDDARLSFPVVQAHGRSSGLNVATPVVLCPPGLGPNPDGTFNNIRGVVWAPEDGTVWVASDNLVQKNDIFREKPQVVLPQITTYGKPYISRVTTQVTSGGNFFLVIDGNNPNYIYKVDPSTGVAAPIPFASTVDSGFLRNIVPAGIAVDPDGLVCYIADASAGKVVMIPAEAGVGTSTITDNWGNRTFTFPDPCGIDVNVSDVNIGHQVIVADDSTGYTWQITGQYTSFPSYQLGTGIHSIQIDQDSSTASWIRYMWSHAWGFTEAFNLNPVVPGDNTSKRYHSAHIFAMDDGHLDVDQDGAILATMRGFVRVVINNSGLTQAYPSPSVQVADRIVAVGLVGWQGVQMHLRVIDPPDLSAYAPDGGWPSIVVPRPSPTPTPVPTPLPPYEANDNVATTDYGLATSPNPTSWSRTLDVIPQDSNNITVYLKVAGTYAGENYQIEITKCKADGTILPQRVAGLSGVYTSWKRVFVERDHMFRNGGLLYSSFSPDSCTPNCNQIRVYNWASVAKNDVIVVFDKTITAEAGGEIRIVASDPVDNGDGTLTITLDANLTLPYIASEPDTSTPPNPTFANFQSGGFGTFCGGCDASGRQINGGSCFYDGDMRGVELPLDDGFVEYVGLRPGSGAIPYISESWFETIYGRPDKSPIRNLSRCWFANFPGSPHSTSYLQLIGAGVFSAGSGAYRYGLTLESDAFSYSFRGSMEAAGAALGLTPSQVDALSQHNVVHELVGHQFWTNICNPGNAYHDTRNAWCNENEPPAVNPNNCGPGSTMPKTCVMEPMTTLASHPELYDGVNRFCLEDLYFGDPTCSPSNPNTAIRTHQDPI